MTEERAPNCQDVVCNHKAHYDGGYCSYQCRIRNIIFKDDVLPEEGEGQAHGKQD